MPQPPRVVPREPVKTPALTPELLRGIIDSAPFATMAFDVDQTVMLWNTGAERLFGWTADEIVGRHLPPEMVPPRDRNGPAAPLCAIR